MFIWRGFNDEISNSKVLSTRKWKRKRKISLIFLQNLKALHLSFKCFVIWYKSSTSCKTKWNYLPLLLLLHIVSTVQLKIYLLIIDRKVPSPLSHFHFSAFRVPFCWKINFHLRLITCSQWPNTHRHMWEKASRNVGQKMNAMGETRKRSSSAHAITL